MSKSVLFLDIDGVLNSFEFAMSSEGKRESLLPDAECLDPKAVAVLQTILEQTKCLVVISSTWRLHYNAQEIANLLVHRGMDPKWKSNFIGETDEDHPPLDAPPKNRCRRGYQIHRYINKLGEGYGPFVILDDDGDMYPHMDLWVPTSIVTGLLPGHAEIVIAMLNGD